jgi:hypothetical protein
MHGEMHSCKKGVLLLPSTPSLMLMLIFNLLKPTGYVMHQQVLHSRISRSAHTVFVCFVFENKQRLVPLTA